MAKATIEINRLHLYAHHGVLDQERKVGNEFEVTVHLDYPCDNAMITDNLDSTINYAEVISILETELSHPVLLLEHAVYRIYTALTSKYSQISGGLITLHKLHPPIAAQVASCGFSYQW